jgi:hypothetical protein
VTTTNRLAVVDAIPESEVDPLWLIADQIEDGHVSEWPIPGFIHSGITVITGQPSAGKTTLALSMASAVLAGGSWLGTAVNPLGDKRVLFLCEDLSSRNRARKALSRYGSRVIVEKAKLWDDQTVQTTTLGDVVRKRNVGLVFIDSLFAIAADETDKPMAALVVSTLQGAGCPVVIVHHQNRAHGTGAGGSQRYNAAYRQYLMVSSTSDSGIIKLNVSGNDLPRTRKLALTIDWSTLEAVTVDDKKFKDSAAKASKLSASEKARTLGKLARGMGLAPGLTHGEYAKKLVGPEGQEDSQRQQKVLDHWGQSKGAGNKTVSNLIKQEREAFDDGFGR